MSAPREDASDRDRPLHEDRKQTGCCGEAQVDGVPCPDPRCDCERCARSRLDPPARG